MRTIAHISQLPMLSDATKIDQALVATMAAELSSNIVKYAGHGRLTITRTERIGTVDIDISATDNGPGIKDIDRAMTDHFSTGTSLGLGLPSVRRMADHFWLQSSPQGGTRICARKRIVGTRQRVGQATPPAGFATPIHVTPTAAPPAGFAASSWELGLSMRPCPGYSVSGDRALSLRSERGLLLGILDASGHGPRADEVVNRCCEIFSTATHANLPRLLAEMDSALLGSLGAAAGLVHLDTEDGSFTYLALGNTRIGHIGIAPWTGFSNEGVLGGGIRRAAVQTGQLRRDDLLLLWTDGLAESGCTALATSLSFRPAQDIASALLRTLAKPYDDAACLVLRWLG